MKTFTKIIATIGPASFDPKIIDALIKSGVSVARLNLAHGTLDEHRSLVKRIRAVAAKNNSEIGIILDLPGPKVRLGELPQPLQITKSHNVILSSKKSLAGTLKGVYLQVPQVIMSALKPGRVVAIDDGNILLSVETMKKDYASASVISGGQITNHKGIAVLGVDLPLPAVTDKDKKALELAPLADYVAVSFVKTADQLDKFKKELKKHLPKGHKAPLVISKIETAKAVKNIDELLLASDIIMVARGDLGLAVDPATLGILQKDIIKKARRARKPVIVATQVLDSVMRQPLPTRAEILDGTNAVIDGADGIMLSGETASGKFPKRAASFLSHVAKAAEDSVYNDVPLEILGSKTTPAHLLAHMIADFVEKHKLKYILNENADPELLNLISSHRLEATQLVPVENDAEGRKLSLWWGVRAYKSGKDPVKKLREDKILPIGTHILAVGYHNGDTTPYLRIVRV